MHEALDQRDFRSRLRRLEEMLAKVDRFTDPGAQACTRAIVQAVLELHGEGLLRLLQNLDATAVEHCAADEVISGLLLLHGLHPLSLDERVRQALDSARPYLNSHGGNVELLDTTDGAVRLRLQGSCHGCPSSAVTLRQTIEAAIWERAPDATAIEVEGEAAEPDPTVAGHSNGFSLPVLTG